MDTIADMLRARGIVEPEVLKLGVPVADPDYAGKTRKACKCPEKFAEVVRGHAADTKTGYVKRCRCCGAQAEAPAPA